MRTVDQGDNPNHNDDRYPQRAPTPIFASLAVLPKDSLVWDCRAPPFGNGYS